MKYRKRPIIVDAVQWFKDGDHPRVDKFCHDGVQYIWTGNQYFPVEPGDWIIFKPNGTSCVVKPGVFEETYEPVGDSVAENAVGNNVETPLSAEALEKFEKDF